MEKCKHKSRKVIERLDHLGVGWFRTKEKCQDCGEIIYGTNLYER